MLAALLALAIPAGTVVVDDPVALDGSTLDAAAAAAARAKAAGALGGDDVLDRAALFARTDPPPPPPSPRAAELLKSGEDLLLTFEYARAAAALAECAAVIEADLAPADLDTLTRARLLEAEAWTEAKDDAAARDALRALLVVRPDVAPDAELLSPAARALFDEAVAAAHGAGTGGLEVRSTPAGAEVVVDGAARGTAPVSLLGLAPGTHRVRVGAPGYAPSTAEVAVVAGAGAVHAVTLAPTPARRALDDAARVAVSGAPAAAVVEEIAAVARAAHVDAVVLVGVRAPGVATRRIDAHPAAAAPAAPLFPPAAAPAPPAVVDEGPAWWVYGALGAGVLAVTALGVAGAVALWPKPAPTPALGVVLEL